MTEPTVHSVAVKLAALEERMNTKQAEYKTDIARLSEENAKREGRLILAVLTIVVAGVVVLGVLMKA